MKSGLIFVILNATFLISSIAAARLKPNHDSMHMATSHSRITRQEPVPLPPNKTCNSSIENDSEYDLANPKNVWICKDSYWIPYQLSVALGSSKQVSGRTCKHIRDVVTTDCPVSKLYWVQEMEVYCEMSSTLDGGGWTLVWQHSYMEDLPLTTNMTFFSDYYKPCTQHATSWCNIPNKARFNPTEQMIVAYLNKQVIYAYKGVFNRDIDYDWSGGVLIAYTKIIDQCISSSSYYSYGYSPQPVKHSIPGIAFGKRNIHNYYGNGGTIAGTFTNPSDNRWKYCRTGSRTSGEQITLAIYVR